MGSTTTSYLIDDVNPTCYPQVMDERVSGAVTRTYAYGLQRISENQLVGSTWTPSFCGYDGHGNVRFLTSSTGTVGNTYTLDAFGTQIASTGSTANNFLYSGEWLDPNLSFYNLRARYYNMLTGRFETMDSYTGRVTEPATLHKYVYVGDDPVGRADASGRDAILETGAIDFSVGLEVLPAILNLRNALWACYAVAAWDLASLIPGVEEPPKWIAKPCDVVSLAFPPGTPVPWDPFKE